MYYKFFIITLLTCFQSIGAQAQDDYLVPFYSDGNYKICNAAGDIMFNYESPRLPNILQRGQIYLERQDSIWSYYAVNGDLLYEGLRKDIKLHDPVKTTPVKGLYLIKDPNLDSIQFYSIHSKSKSSLYSKYLQSALMFNLPSSVYVLRDSRGLVVIDKNAKEVFNQPITSFYSFDKIFHVQIKKQHFLYDHDLNVVNGPFDKFTPAVRTPGCSNFIAVRDNVHELLDVNGLTINSFNSEYVKFLDNKHIAIKLDTGFKILNLETNVATNVDCDHIKSYHDGLGTNFITCSTNISSTTSQSRIIDVDGKTIIDENSIDIRPLRKNKIVLVGQKSTSIYTNKYELISKVEKPLYVHDLSIVPFYAVTPYFDLDSKVFTGVINAYGETVIDDSFDNVARFKVFKSDSILIDKLNGTKVYNYNGDVLFESNDKLSLRKQNDCLILSDKIGNVTAIDLISDKVVYTGKKADFKIEELQKNNLSIEKENTVQHIGNSSNYIEKENGYYGIRDSKGTVICPAVFDTICNTFNEKIKILYKKGKSYIYFNRDHLPFDQTTVAWDYKKYVIDLNKWKVIKSNVSMVPLILKSLDSNEYRVFFEEGYGSKADLKHYPDIAYKIERTSLKNPRSGMSREFLPMHLFFIYDSQEMKRFVKNLKTGKEYRD